MNKKSSIKRVRFSLLASALTLASVALWGSMASGQSAGTNSGAIDLSDMPVGTEFLTTSGAGGGLFIAGDDGAQMERYYMPEDQDGSRKMYEATKQKDSAGGNLQSYAYRDLFFSGYVTAKFLLEPETNRLAYNPSVTYLPAQDVYQLRNLDQGFGSLGWHENVRGMPRLASYSQYQLTPPGKYDKNFMNWALFYRNRLAANKAVTSAALAAICPDDNACSGLQIGFGAFRQMVPKYTNPSSAQSGMGQPGYTSGDYHYGQSGKAVGTIAPAGFTGAHRQAVFDAIHNYSIDASSPLRGALKVIADNYSGDLGKAGSSTGSTGKGSGKTGAEVCSNGGGGGVLMFTDGQYTLDAVGNKTVTEMMKDYKNKFSLSIFSFGSLDKNGKSDDKMIKDLMEATKISGGLFVGSTNPQDYIEAMKQITGSGEPLEVNATYSGTAFANINLFDYTQQYAYTPSFSTDGSGDLERHQYKQNRKVEDPDKSAAEELDARDYKTRKLFTKNNLPLTVDSISKVAVDASVYPAEVLDYLAGNKSKDGSDGFRQRASLMGSIVYATPVVADAPVCSGKEVSIYCSIKLDGYKEFYQSYLDGKLRKLRVYAPANDGFVHAFDEDLKEVWAYMPSQLLRDSASGGIINYAKPPEDENNPRAQYAFVDATPAYQDVQFDDGKWHSMLIGGLGKGGTMYYGLDVTSGDADKTNVWEFTDDNMGYSYGRPVITRTNGIKDANDKSRWVAVLPSGYNNGSSGNPVNGNKGDGKACLYFVDLEKGEQIKHTGSDWANGRLCAPEGSAADPLNLVSIAAFVDKESTQLAQAIYGGDSKGNFWRFDISSTDPSDWSVEKLGVLKDKNGKPQYVTTEPYPYLVGGKRYVAVGTGGFRNEADLKSDIINTLYVFLDGSVKTAGTDTEIKRAAMTEVKYSEIGWTAEELAGKEQTLSAESFSWYMDLPAEYHINVSPKGFGANVIIAANKYKSKDNIVDIEECNASMFEGMYFSRDVASGKSSLLDDKGSPIAYAEVVDGIADLAVVVTPKEPGNKESNKADVNIVITDTNGKLIDSGKSINVKRSQSQGIPQKANIRYVKGAE